MRITLTYFEGHQELEDELSKLPPRARAARLRVLASMGLNALQNSQAALITRSVAPVVPTVPVAPVAKKQPSSTKDKIISNTFGQV